MVQTNCTFGPFYTHLSYESSELGFKMGEIKHEQAWSIIKWKGYGVLLMDGVKIVASSSKATSHITQASHAS